MSKEQNNETDKKAVKKKTIGDRMLTWGINLVLGGGLIWWIMSMQGDQEQKFHQGIVDTATIECNEDRACLDNLKAHFNECASVYASKEKAGKFTKKYTLDKEGFDGCINETL